MRQYSLEPDGFAIVRSVLSDSHVETLRKEADAVAASAGSACVRHLRSRSRIFADLSICQALLSLLPAPLRPVRSILFDKTPDENWPVAWHQDLTITVAQQQDIAGYGPWSQKDGAPHVQPPLSLLQNMITIRLHLDETPASNGALRVIPGSHRNGRISAESICTFDPAHAVICECSPGDALLMSPLLLHSSMRSIQPARRRVIHFEYAPENALDPRLNWHEALD